eukprot:SAG11_NODE_28642_length_319_cov_1.118182_1_plen_56_part_01
MSRWLALDDSAACMMSVESLELKAPNCLAKHEAVAQPSVTQGLPMLPKGDGVRSCS